MYNKFDCSFEQFNYFLVRATTHPFIIYMYMAELSKYVLFNFMYCWLHILICMMLPLVFFTCSWERNNVLIHNRDIQWQGPEIRKREAPNPYTFYSLNTKIVAYQILPSPFLHIYQGQDLDWRSNAQKSEQFINQTWPKVYKNFVLSNSSTFIINIIKSNIVRKQVYD